LTYGQDHDADERLWAAGELFRTTQNSVYNKYFLANYRSGLPSGRARSSSLRG
jgi:hypothetical protein